LKFSRLLLFCLVFLFASTAFSQIYEWVDENGVKRYSNQAPPKNARDVKQYDEVITQNADDSSLPSNENTQETIQKKETEAVKSKGQDQTGDDKKVVDASDDSQDSDTVKRLKRTLEKRTTTNKQRKLLRRLKAAEAKEKQEAGKSN
jgi:hypothetical protein